MRTAELTLASPAPRPVAIDLMLHYESSSNLRATRWSHNAHNLISQLYRRVCPRAPATLLQRMSPSTTWRLIYLQVFEACEDIKETGYYKAIKSMK